MILNRSKDTSWKAVDGGGVILHLKTGDYYSLNLLGLKVWKLCDGKHDRERIKSLVAKAYGARSKKVGSDVEQFLARLLKEKLVEVGASLGRRAS